MFIGLGQLKLKSFHVEWKDIADVWLYWNDVKSRIIRNVGQKIGLSSGIILQCHATKKKRSLSYKYKLAIALLAKMLDIKISDFFGAI